MENLREVEISGIMTSCTRFIKPIKITHMNEDDEEEDIIICDCPGLEDTRGPELDIANIYGVVYAAWGCKGIIPIITLSKDKWPKKIIPNPCKL